MDANWWGWVKARNTYGLLAGRFRHSTSPLRHDVVTLQGRLQDPQIHGHSSPAYRTLWQHMSHAFTAHPRVAARQQSVFKVMSIAMTYHTETLYRVVRVTVVFITDIL